MTIGEIAGLIAAFAFLVLVIFLCNSLMKLTAILKDANVTVQRVNTTLDVVTKDVDSLAIEVEALLNKTNHLVDDVNGKLSKTDPLFAAIGEVGETVSELNTSTKNMAVNITSGIGKKNKKSSFSPIMKLASFGKNKEKKATIKKEEDSSKLDEILAEIESKPTSTTAGEITIN